MAKSHHYDAQLSQSTSIRAFPMATFLALIVFTQLAYVAYLVSSAFRTLITKREVDRIDLKILVYHLGVAYFAGIAIENAKIDPIPSYIDGAWQTLMLLLVAAIGLLLFAKLVGVRNAR